MPDLIDISTFDTPGVLSIVMQCGLSADNLVQTAQHAGHWRDLFPAAQIVLALSITDVVQGERSTTGELQGVRLTPPFRRNAQLQLALELVLRVCDKIVLSPGALPLPQIKSDSSINNINLQIQAARSGLAVADGQYCLRIRADMVFTNRTFIRFYVNEFALQRGKTAKLRQRVMISQYFTLNPFTLERLPLHFSDWFNFGLLDDVRMLWDVPPMSYGDSIYYRVNDYHPASNELERMFYVRLAVEQHIALACFKAFIPDLQIDYHNDRRSAEIGCRILVDNFVVCDVQACGLYFEKYDHAKYDTEMAVKCITHDDWLSLAQHPELDCGVFFQAKTDEASRMIEQRRWARLSPRKRLLKRLGWT